MVARGEVGLIVATALFGRALIGESEYTGVVFATLVATLLAPLLLRAAFADRPKREKKKAKTAKTGG
jgi:Kef-type K+ transport system membrane component KefB